MTADGISALTWLMETVFKFFTSWNIPGTTTTPAGWLLFITVSAIVFKFIKAFLTQDLKE